MYKTLASAVGNRVGELVSEYERAQYYFAKMAKRHNDPTLFETAFDESLDDYINRANLTNIRQQVKEHELVAWGTVLLDDTT